MGAASSAELARSLVSCATHPLHTSSTHRPEGTEPFDMHSVDSPMKIDPRTRMCRLELRLPQKVLVQTGSDRAAVPGQGLTASGVVFVLRDIMTDRWIKQASGNDLFVRIRK